MTRPDWPKTRRRDHESNERKRYSYGDIDIDIFNDDENLCSSDIGSLSGEESSNDYEISEDDEDYFKESERRVNLDGWMSDVSSRDAPDVSLSHRDSGHEFSFEAAVESAEEFLKLLFELSL
jgi:hypothetical protein